MRGTARLWTLRSKFYTIIETVSDSDIHLFKLDGLLEIFALEISNEFKSKTLNDQSSQSKSNVGSTFSVVIFRDDEELTIRNSLSPVATNGRPKSAFRI